MMPGVVSSPASKKLALFALFFVWGGAFAEVWGSGYECTAPVSKDHKHFIGPSAGGLHVSGGSRMKQAARRARAFRDVRVQPPSQNQELLMQEQVEESLQDLIQPPEQEPYYQEMAVVAPPTPPPTMQVPTYHQPDSRKAIVYMGLLAIQFGIQPLLVRRFTAPSTIKSTVVLTQEIFKFGIAYAAYFSTTRQEHRSQELSTLSVKTWVAMAGVPAFLYTIQNLASLLAYQNLEALTFNVINQTKNLSAALCCYLIMGKKQSRVQAFSLMLLLVSALVIEKVLSLQTIVSGVFGRGGVLSFGALRSMASSSRHVTHGVLPLLLASLISGLAGALTQKNLQGEASKMTKPRNAYLFSMELTAASAIVLLLSLLVSSDGRKIIELGFFHGWTASSLIPVFTNSVGGILVGLVTKHAGSVRKGFALIFGILLSGLIQAGSAGLSMAQIVGGVLAATSLWLHATHPCQ